jgi:outer membrane receptor protein involved in Fe transport
VLKGPATGLYGMGSAGGVINLIEKKPAFDSKQLFEAEVGQWDTYSLMADTTGGISDNLAYRLVAKSARSQGYRDLGTDRDEIYGSLKYVLNETYYDKAMFVGGLPGEERNAKLTVTYRI